MQTFLGLDYNIWWFLVFGAVISGYAILDGFDLGAGCLHLFLKRNDSRQMAMYAIGPVWDGNEVWLVIGGGALFAGFPVAYAAIFSAFYIPFIFFLLGLIFRGIAIEVRDREKSALWQECWDMGYCLSSIVISLSLGLMLGNVVEGIPLNDDKEFAGSWTTFFNPFAILVAITTMALFMMHGAIYLMIKTEDILLEKLHGLANKFTVFFILSFFITTIYTICFVPYLNRFLKGHPVFYALPVLILLCIANIPRQIKSGKYRLAFVFSAMTIALLLVMVAREVFPNLLYSPGNPAHSITIYNGASSLKSMHTLLTIALIGVPLVGIYTVFVFWTFKGKVKTDHFE